MREYVDFLGSQSPYDELDASDLEALARLVEVEYFTAGTIIITAGEPPLSHFYVVSSGEVEVVDRGLGDGQRVLLHRWRHLDRAADAGHPGSARDHEQRAAGQRHPGHLSWLRLCQRHRGRRNAGVLRLPGDGAADRDSGPVVAGP